MRAERVLQSLIPQGQQGKLRAEGQRWMVQAGRKASVGCTQEKSRHTWLGRATPIWPHTGWGRPGAQRLKSQLKSRERKVEGKKYLISSLTKRGASHRCMHCHIWVNPTSSRATGFISFTIQTRHFCLRQMLR